MAHVRLTLLRPRPGSESELLHLLEDLDESLAGAPGMLFSLVLSQGDRLGRVSLWQSKDGANREAMSPHTLSVRPRLRYLSLETNETFMEVVSGHLPEGFNALFAAAKQPAHFPETAQQQALPA